MAGVTVRTLHHYDRMGLLKARRTPAGYRVYSPQDLEVLEQIVVLKFLGIPLREVAGLLGTGSRRLADRLHAQRSTLEHKAELLNRAIAAVRDLEASLATGASASPDLFKRIIEVIEMQNKPDTWTRQYEGLVAEKAERLRAMTPEAMAALRSDWTTLVADIRTAMPAGPDGPSAQLLGRRWTALLEQVMGRPIGVAVLSGHQQAQPWTPAMATFVDKDVWEFMSQVLAGTPSA